MQPLLDGEVIQGDGEGNLSIPVSSIQEPHGDSEPSVFFLFFFFFLASFSLSFFLFFFFCFSSSFFVPQIGEGGINLRFIGRGRDDSLRGFCYIATAISSGKAKAILDGLLLFRRQLDAAA